MIPPKRARLELILILLSLGWIVRVSEGQELYSATVQWIPTGKPDEFQIYFHLSWEEPQANKLSCAVSASACVVAYRLSNKPAQTFGRLAFYTLDCTTGCPGSLVLVSDLNNVFFTSIRNQFQNVTWEAGDDTLIYDFTSANDVVEIGFQSNGTRMNELGSTRLRLGVRNDTQRANISPSLAVLPVYIVPLGCSIEISMNPYDGDGDSVRCKWKSRLPGAQLDETLCTVTLKATSANGFVSGQRYNMTVYGEDFSSNGVNITRKSASSISKGPFSRVLAMFTVHVSPAPSDLSVCSDKAGIVANHTEKTLSYKAPFSYTDTFSTQDPGVTFVTVGHEGMSFYPGGLTERVNMTEANVSAMGIYRTCVMAYSQSGVPGSSVCDTLLIGDSDDCANSTCTSDGGDCRDFYNHHTCIYQPTDAEGSLNIALIAGAAAGGAVLLAVLVVMLLLYKRYRSKQRRKIASDQTVVSS